MDILDLKIWTVLKIDWLLWHIVEFADTILCNFLLYKIIN